jgi:hypothetical protein
VTGFAAGTSAKISFAILACASRFTGVTACVYATPCSSGLQLASRYVANPETDSIFDYLPESLIMERTRNLYDFARVLVLDKWACNADGRQAVFTKPATARKYSATFIDQGYCFNASEWNFPDSPLRGVYCHNLSISMSPDGSPWNPPSAGLSRWTAQTFGDSLKECRRNGGLAMIPGTCPA